MIVGVGFVRLNRRNYVVFANQLLDAVVADAELSDF